MRKLIIEKENVVTLDAVGTNLSTYIVTLTVVGEDGAVLTKSDDTPMTDIPCVWNTDKNKFGVSLNFKTTTSQQYARLFWNVKKVNDTIELPEEYDPESVQLRSTSAAVQPEVASVDYFIENILAISSKLDDAYETAVKSYPREGIRNHILAAQGNVENMTKLNLFKQEYNEVRDYNFDQQFCDTFWMMQLYQRPIVSVDSWDLWHGGTKILVVPIHDVQIESKQGTIEFVPTSSTGGLLFQQLIASGEGIKMAVIGHGMASRLPHAWHIKYHAGIDFPNLPLSKKENFRLGICRNALIELLPHIDPATRTTSSSESMDGVSMSSSKTVDTIIKELRLSQEEWLKNIEKEYATGFDMVVI